MDTPETVDQVGANAPVSTPVAETPVAETPPPEVVPVITSPKTINFMLSFDPEHKMPLRWTIFNPSGTVAAERVTEAFHVMFPMPAPGQYQLWVNPVNDPSGVGLSFHTDLVVTESDAQLGGNVPAGVAVVTE